MYLLHESAHEGRWLRLFLAAIIIAASGTFLRPRWLTLSSGLVAIVPLVFVKHGIETGLVRAFGADSLGRTTETEAMSTISTGAYVAAGGTLLIVVSGLWRLVSRPS